MVCRLAVAEFDCACTVNGKVIEPPPPVPPPPLPPPLFVDPPQDASPVANPASSRINASGRAKAAALCLWAPQCDDVCRRSPAALRFPVITITKNIIAPIAHIHAETMGMFFGVEPGSPAAAAKGFTETPTFSVADAVPFADMFSGFGLNVQATPAGAPPHENVKEPATVFVDFTDKLNVAVPFTLITADAGEIDAVTPLRLKTGGGGVSPWESPLSRMSALLPEFPSQTM
jgi:hypothetical protein